MHSLLKLAALAVLGASAQAQRGLDLQPCNEIRDAGTFHLLSGVLTPANGVAHFVTEAVIYDNTCPTPSFTALLSGNSNLDEGRLPSTTSPVPDTGTFNKYRVTKFQIAYCTRELDVSAGGPGAQVTIRFFESYTPCTASGANPPAAATFALTGLPASAALGALSCYFLTIDLAGGGEFYMRADSDGVFDGATDLFGFSYSFPGQTGTTTATVGGPIVAGDLTPPGDCAAGDATYYKNPGAASGTGLGNGNFFYREGSNPAQTINACLFFGAPPALHAGFYMRIYGDLDDCNGNANPDLDDIAGGGSADANANGIPDECECGDSTYCTSGTSMNGCVPTISGAGTPSASAPSGYTVSVTGMDPLRPAGMFYGLGAAATQINPGGGGTSYFCTTAPRQRLITPMPNTGGSSGCDGSLSVDLNNWMTTHPLGLGSPFLAGQTLYVQSFNRDNGNPSKGLVLSNGLAVTLCP